MLQFETLLLRQFQKQQNRDEFCDAVLQAQGISVPVHSCVLSAFSPRLYGTLSSMPVPMTGQRRLIELQAVDAGTLLGLVSLLYSGQLHENREQVLSAAQTLGIELPQWQEEEEKRHEETVEKRKEREDAEQGIEKNVREQDARMTKRSEGETEKIRENATQTECRRVTDEKGSQTYLACSELQGIQTLYLTDSTNQELGSYVDVHETPLPLQAIDPERISTTCDVLAVAPETGDCQTVSESASMSQIYQYSLGTSHNQPSSSITLSQNNILLDQSLAVPSAGADALNHLEQFEGNIPGFISCFLDSTNSQNIGRRGQSCSMTGAKEDQVVKRGKARSTGGGSVKEWVRRIEGGKRQRRTLRQGLVARLAWRGQGGGRVGRLLETRSTRKNPVRLRQSQQSREAFLGEGEVRGRGRYRQRGKTGTVAGSDEQNGRPRRGRPRGRPRLRQLPPAASNYSALTPTTQNTVDPTQLDLIHTVTPMPAAPIEPIQPIDTFLNDIMTGLHFIPSAENQHGLTNPTISKAMFPNSHYLKPTDPKQHLEGDISDVLDHFLRTFEQQVDCCALDLSYDTMQDNEGRFDAGNDKSDPCTDPMSSISKTYTQLQPYNPHHQNPQANILHSSSTPITQPQISSTVNPSGAETTSAQDGPRRGSEVEKPFTDQDHVQLFENQRMTRSQSVKRKLEVALISLQKPVKRMYREKQIADTREKMEDRGQIKTHVNKRGVNNMDKNKTNRTVQALGKEKQKQASTKERRHGVNQTGRKRRSRTDGVYEQAKSLQVEKPGTKGRSKTRKKVREARVEVERISNAFETGHSSVKGQIGEACIEIASSAMEKVRMLLQLQNEEEGEGGNESVELQKVNKIGNGRLVDHSCVSGAEEILPVENGQLGDIQELEDEGRMMVNRDFEGQERRKSRSIVEVRQENIERMASRLSQGEWTTEGCSTSFQLNLHSNTGKDGTSNSETTLSTTESHTSVIDSCQGDPASALGVRSLQTKAVPTSTQSIMHKMADFLLDVEHVSPAQRPQVQPCQDLLSPHASTKDMQLAESPVNEDEDEDVDVLEVSSPSSEAPALSTVILGVDLGTEEEDVEEDDDDEIDVLGLDAD